MKLTIETADDQALDYLESKIEEALIDGKEVDDDFVNDVFYEYQNKLNVTEDSDE
jgi:hypothetical protein